MEAPGAPIVLFPVNSMKKSTKTASTAALFKKTTPLQSAKLPTSKRKKDSQTKYAITSKPQGIRKRALMNNARRTRHEAELAQLAQRSTLSSEFNETSNGVREAVITSAEALLHTAQASLLHRIDSTYGCNSSPTKHGQPTKPAKPTKGPFLSSSNHDGEEDPRHVPTSSEICRSHNRTVAQLARALADEKLKYGADPKKGTPAETKILGDEMESFRRVVAAEEKRIASLEAEWDAVQDEIRSLAHTITRGAFTEAGFVAGVKQKRGSIDSDVIERLRQEVQDVADEFDGRAKEINEAEKVLKSRQERFLADTIRSLGNL